MKNEELSRLNEKLKNLKSQYRYHQISQEDERKYFYCYDPYDYEDEDVSKEEHEMRCQYRIVSNRYVLRSLQNEIKETRKKIKTIQRNGNR